MEKSFYKVYSSKDYYSIIVKFLIESIILNKIIRNPILISSNDTIKPQQKNFLKWLF